MTNNIVAQQDKLIPAMSEESIERAEEIQEMLLSLPQVYLTTDHILHAGVYVRTIMIPKGVAITGALIKRSVNLSIAGHCIVYLGDEEAREFRGYAVFTAMAHRKQVFIAQEDTFLTMFFATSAKSVEEAENEFTDEAELLMSRQAEGINNITITGV